MTIFLIVAAVVSVVVFYLELTNPFPTPDAAPAPALDPHVPACARIGHRMLLSDLGTWWFCSNDHCDQMWPADDAHHVDLPYDREAVQLVDETEQFLRRVS
jgi:hypothetical protein